MKRFSDLVVIERGGSVAGAYCAKLFADNGAQVLAVRTKHDTLNGFQRLYLDSSKTTTETSPSTATADVIIDSSLVDPLAGRHEAMDCDPHIQSQVRVEISGFGRSGPRAQWKGSDLIDYALSGHLHLYGDPNREPLRGPANQPSFAAGLYGFIGAMAALLARERDGQGQLVEVSRVQTMVALHQFTLLRQVMAGSVLKRMGNRFAGQGQPNGIYRCADGWVAIATPAELQVETLLGITGLDHLMDGETIQSALDFQVHPRLLDDALEPWLAERPVQEICDLFQAVRVPACPVMTLCELLNEPQLAQRDYWRDLEGVTVPGPGFRITAGSKSAEAGGETAATKPNRAIGGGPNSAGPLSQLRVLDLTRVWAGPLATRILADLGADVLWIEAPWARGPRQVPDSLVQATHQFPNDDPGRRPWNRNSHFVKYAMGKRSLAVDLSTNDGVGLLKSLIAQYDVIIENYSPRVMPQLGLGDQTLFELNPDIISVTMPGYGRTGPRRDWLAYGSSIDSHAGLSSLIGYPDRSPWKGGVAWPDPVGGLHATAGLLVALWSQQSSGGRGGAIVETAQFEATVALIGDRLVEAQQVGDPPPVGNREPAYVAQGVYPCVGDDKWVAVSVPDDQTWAALCRATGLDPNLKDDHDRLDEALAAWTVSQIDTDVAEYLQSCGVPAGAVADSAMIMTDPHLWALDTFQTVNQPEIGSFTTPRTPISLSLTPAIIRGPAPILGQHNHDVLALELGLEPGEIERLNQSGVIADKPPA